MERTSQCPDCSRGLKPGGRNCICGWEAPQAPGSRRVDGPPADPERGRCDWVSGLGRCRFPGTLSEGTRGDLPFFCAWHFQCGDPAYGERVVRQSRDWDGMTESYLAMRQGRETQREPLPAAGAKQVAVLAKMLGIKPPALVQDEPGSLG
jgi:hypothetical protein